MPQGGSFMWAIRDEQRKRGYLFNGPQLGFSIPELFWEFEVHSAIQDIRGVSAAGIPVMGIGHNDDVAWGFTSGLSDEDDLYAVELVDDDTYTYKGKPRDMDCRDETFDYNAPVTDIPGITDPSDLSGSVTERSAAPSTARSRRAATAWPTPAATRSGAASSTRWPASRSSTTRRTSRTSTRPWTRSPGTRT